MMPQDSKSEPTTKDGISPPFRFRLVHVIYLVTLLGVSLGAFGPLGVLPAIVVGVFWIKVFFSRSRRTGFWNALLLFSVCCCCGGGLLLPAMRGSPSAVRRMVCSNNVKQIAFALRSYHNIYEEFPPAYLADATGKPMHSWRVLILPFVGNEGGRYDKYRFDEPWDGPNNRQLLEPMPPVFACPSSDNSPHTSYVAVIGPDTLWPGATSKRLGEITDQTEQTILFVESAEPPILWMEPRDLAYDDALNCFSGATEIARHDAHWFNGYFDEQYSGRMVALADGTVEFVNGLLARDPWSRLLRINDGGHDVNFGGAGQGPTRTLYANYMRFAFWIVVAIWPTPFVLSGKRPRTPQAQIAANQ